ncbi:hypothetical protein AKJ16_DCAP06540 [Drosera capensis]
MFIHEANLTCFLKSQSLDKSPLVSRRTHHSQSIVHLSEFIHEAISSDECDQHDRVVGNNWVVNVPCRALMKPDMILNQCQCH